MKILITGKNGQVGFEMQHALTPLGEVVAIDHLECANWVFGVYDGNFAKTMLRLANERDAQRSLPISSVLRPLPCCRPTSPPRLARGQDSLPNRALPPHRRRSHCLAPLRAGHPAELAGKPLKIKAGDIRLDHLMDYPLRAPRSANSHFVPVRLPATFCLRLPDRQSGLDHVLYKFSDGDSIHA